MGLYEKIKEAYPDIIDFIFLDTIILQDDVDGKGEFIAKWEYSKPLPAGMKVGKN